MKILILGANGYLGARLFLDLRDFFEVTGTYNRNQFHDSFIKLDITDEAQLNQVFTEIQPDVVIQTANYPSPRHATDNEDGYRDLNLRSTEYIVQVADQVGAKVIFISSFAALNPDNIYGQLKLQSEKIVSTAKEGYLVLRPSLILGLSPNIDNDRPFNRVLKCINSTASIEFDTSWEFQPTYIGHISAVIKTAISKNIWNHLVHVFSPSIETQFSTARDILEPFGVAVSVVDKGMNMPVQERDERELSELGLPTYSYTKMIDSIHEEIKHKEAFVL